MYLPAEEENAQDNDQSSETQAEDDAQVLNPALSSSLYCYTVLPGYDGPADNRDCNVEWNGMGVGEIEDDPWLYSIGATLPLDSVSYTLPETFPDITYKGIALRYSDAEDPPEYTYSIDWTQIVVSEGANEGHNSYNPFVDEWQQTFHLNGYVHLNLPHKYTVIFEVQEPGMSGYSTVSENSFEVDEGTLLSDIVPKEEEEKVYDNGVYTFDGWYSDPACTQLADSADIKIDANAVYYGHYVLKGKHMLSISKTVVNGTEEDEDRSFTFHLTLEKDGEDYAGPVEIVESASGPGILWPEEDGTYSFTLKSGQMLILGITEGDVFTVEEEDPGSAWTTMVSLNTQDAVLSHSASGTMKERASAAFTNYRNVSAPTGWYSSLHSWLAVAAAIGLCLALLALRLRNSRSR